MVFSLNEPMAPRKARRNMMPPKAINNTETSKNMSNMPSVSELPEL